MRRVPPDSQCVLVRVVSRSPLIRALRAFGERQTKSPIGRSKTFRAATRARPANDVLAQYPTVPLPDKSADKPSKWSLLLDRLMGKGWAPRAECIEVRVATLAEDVEGIHSRHVVEAMHRQGGFTARRLDESIELGLIGDPGEQLLKAASTGANGSQGPRRSVGMGRGATARRDVDLEVRFGTGRG